MVLRCKTVLTASMSRMSPWGIVRKLDWSSGLNHLALREAWEFLGRAGQGCAGVFEPAQSPVAPKKAIVRVVDIVAVVAG